MEKDFKDEDDPPDVNSSLEWAPINELDSLPSTSKDGVDKTAKNKVKGATPDCTESKVKMDIDIVCKFYQPYLLEHTVHMYIYVWHLAPGSRFSVSYTHLTLPTKA